MHIWNLELAAKKDDCQFGASGFLNGNAFEAIFSSSPAVGSVFLLSRVKLCLDVKPPFPGWKSLLGRGLMAHL